MTAKPSSRSWTKLTPEVAATICAEIGKGRPVTVAVDIARIHRQTFYDWVARGEGGLEPYASFVADMKAARANAQGNTLSRIEAAGEESVCPTCQCETRCVAPGDWKAHAWIAERLYPETLHLTQKHEVQVQQGVESLLTAIRPRMSGGAYAELVTAIASVQGLDPQGDGGDVVEQPAALGSGDD